MVYTSGDQILASHYNNRGMQVNTVWAVGSGDSGYGQTPIEPTPAGSVITATQWATLFSRLMLAAAHQGTTIAPLASPTVGTQIQALAILQNNIELIQTNRRNAVALGSDITANGVATRTTGWVNEIVMEYTVGFASANAMRYFFNAGGQIRLNFSRTAGSAHAKNADWTALCNACGTIVITGGGDRVVASVNYSGTNKIGGSGSPTTLASTTGALGLGTGNTTLFVQRSVDSIYGGYSTYNANRIEVLARRNSTSTNIVIPVRFIDDALDNSPGDLDVVSGTLQTTMVLRPPSTTHISNTWGTPTMSATVTGS